VEIFVATEFENAIPTGAARLKRSGQNEWQVPRRPHYIGRRPTSMAFHETATNPAPNRSFAPHPATLAESL
jgi:hypothetical protein